MIIARQNSNGHQTRTTTDNLVAQRLATTVPPTLRVGPGSSAAKLCRMNDLHDAEAPSDAGTPPDPTRGTLPDDAPAPTAGFFPEA